MYFIFLVSSKCIVLRHNIFILHFRRLKMEPENALYKQKNQVCRFHVSFCGVYISYHRWPSNWPNIFAIQDSKSYRFRGLFIGNFTEKNLRGMNIAKHNQCGGAISAVILHPSKWWTNMRFFFWNMHHPYLQMDMWGLQTQPSWTNDSQVLGTNNLYFFNFHQAQELESFSRKPQHKTGVMVIRVYPCIPKIVTFQTHAISHTTWNVYPP